MRKAFTLVEVLVVIGIIAVLIAILLPTLRAAREESNKIACLSNLRQLALTAQNYAVAYKDSYPIATQSISVAWDFRINGSAVEPGILWMGRTDMKIQQCPSCNVKSPTITDPYTGYNYNISYIGHGVGEFKVAPIKASHVHRAAEVALFGDGEYFGGTNKFMRCPLKDTPVTDGDNVGAGTRSAGTQGYRHRGGRTNVAFCDGHAESLLPPAGVTPAATGFLSIDNSAYCPR
jgi:prepilin-type processing-associated H-X9-DG protein/prepilin-type N-terminal cleavage/methylation domain-containing protein